MVELDAGFGQVKEVPVRHRLGSILTSGRFMGGGDLRRRFPAVGKSPLDGSDFGDEGSALLGVRDRSISGHCRCEGQYAKRPIC